MQILPFGLLKKPILFSLLFLIYFIPSASAQELFLPEDSITHKIVYTEIISYDNSDSGRLISLANEFVKEGYPPMRKKELPYTFYEFSYDEKTYTVHATGLITYRTGSSGPSTFSGGPVSFQTNTRDSIQTFFELSIQFRWGRYKYIVSGFSVVRDADDQKADIDADNRGHFSKREWKGLKKEIDKQVKWMIFCLKQKMNSRPSG